MESTFAEAGSGLLVVAAHEGLLKSERFTVVVMLDQFLQEGDENMVKAQVHEGRRSRCKSESQKEGRHKRNRV
jgi:hypothetical protein